MAKSFNKVILIGNLGEEPTIRAIASGKMANFSLVTNEYRAKEGGGFEDIPSWHRIVAYGYQADYIERTFHKGNRVMIEGKLKYSNYTDRNGVKRYSTDIVVENAINLSPRQDGMGYASEDTAAPQNSFDAPSGWGAAPAPNNFNAPQQSVPNYGAPNMGGNGGNFNNFQSPATQNAGFNSAFAQNQSPESAYQSFSQMGRAPQPQPPMAGAANGNDMGGMNANFSASNQSPMMNTPAADDDVPF